MREAIELLTQQLAEIEKRKHYERYTHPHDEVHVKFGKKYAKIDIGTSGAWMVEIETGEIYNIKGYGVPDKNKKQKSDIGNAVTVDPERMHNMRHNYLR